MRKFSLVVIAVVILLGLVAYFKEAASRVPPPLRSASEAVLPREESSGVDAVGEAGRKEGRAAPSSRKVEVEVLDRDGAPVPGAEVSISADGGDWERAESTGRSGKSTISLAETQAQVSLVARHRDYAVCEVNLVDSDIREALETGRISVVLQPGACVSGTVRIAGDTPLPAGLSVLAAQRWTGTEDEQRVSEILRNPGVLCAEVEEGGRFEIQNVLEGHDYELVAGGEGWLSAYPISCSGGDADVQVPVLRMYSLAVELRDEYGGELPDLTGVFWRPPTGVVQPEGCRPLSSGLSSGLRVLSGWAPPKEFAERVKSGRALLSVYLADASRDYLGPVSAYITFPGYQPARAMLKAYPCGGAQMRVQRVSLVPRESVTTGQLALDIVRRSGEASSESGEAMRRLSRSIHCIVQLRRKSPIEEDRYTLEFAATGSLPVKIRAGCVPTGEYDVYAVACVGGGFPTSKIGDVEVKVRAPNDVPKMELPRHGRLLVKGGRPGFNDRFATRRLTRGGRAQVLQYYFEDGGTPILGLDSGRIEIFDPSGDNLFQSTTVDVVPGLVRIIDTSE